MFAKHDTRFGLARTPLPGAAAEIAASLRHQSMCCSAPKSVVASAIGQQIAQQGAIRANLQRHTLLRPGLRSLGKFI
jgi:hypothetical protein